MYHLVDNLMENCKNFKTGKNFLLAPMCEIVIFFRKAIVDNFIILKYYNSTILNNSSIFCILLIWFCSFSASVKSLFLSLAASAIFLLSILRDDHLESGFIYFLWFIVVFKYFLIFDSSLATVSSCVPYCHFTVLLLVSLLPLACSFVNYHLLSTVQRQAISLCLFHFYVSLVCLKSLNYM